MIFTDLRLQNYRSYTDASFELGSGVNIVVGPNAAGKTNLLEAIMVSSVGKSYRSRDINLVRCEQPWARIDVHTNENVQRSVKLQIDPSGSLQKTFEIDEKTYKRFPAAHKQPIVLFEPNDLLEQYVTGYEQHRSHYKRVLAQRNALLKQGKHGGSQLFAWNLRLIDLGEQLVSQRLQLLEAVNQSISTTYSMIAGHDKKIKLHYESSIDVKNYGTSLLKKLESSVELDMARGFTGTGPHRDDIVVYFGEEPALQSASRGEVRTLVLALKIIELQILEKKRGIRPLLLLDDVFSELDGARRRALTNFLKDYQTIITTTDADVVIQHFTEKCTILPLS